MREIKFRGKRTKNGEWVYGWYVERQDTHHNAYSVIICEEDEVAFEVDPETVGQYTGLKDKNGKEKEVYQDDVIDFFGLRLYIIAWNEKTGQWVGHVVGNKNIQKPLWEILKIYRTVAKGHPGEGLHYNYPKIIGNIHSNPELLEGDE